MAEDRPTTRSPDRRTTAEQALFDAVMSKLAEKSGSKSVPSAPPRPAYDGLYEAASVLGWFDPRTLRPTRPVEDGALDRLVAASVTVTDDQGRRRHCLGPDERVAVLRQLRERDAVTDALQANSAPPGDTLHRLIRAHLSGTAEPIETLSLEGLHSTALVCQWLRSAGFENLPDPALITRRTAWLTLLEPFELLAGKHFRGRQAELARLREYVGVLAPGSSEQPARPTKPATPRVPMLIYGPGGVGKSTLLARFILDHAQALERDRFPFVYLDFDRPDVDSAEPLTLLIEALDQLAVEYPEAEPRTAPIREGWLNLLHRPDLPDRARLAAAREFGSLLHSLGASDRPVVFVLDTFEEVQWRSAEHVAKIWEMLGRISAAAPQLRVVIAGRGEIAGYAVEPIALAGLDQSAAVGFLQAHGLTDAALAARVAAQVQGDPQSLELIARSYQQHGAPALDDLLEPGLIRQKLYHRILGHVHDPDIRRLAHPGLVLRRVTPELILKVLAGPCGLSIDSLDDARRLFDELARETALVKLDYDGALVHRPDLRKSILSLLEADEPDKTREIHRAAIDYYVTRSANPKERAEEIYHRLKLGEDPQASADRWLLGMETHLINAVDEFDGSTHAFLAARLGLVVSDPVRAAATLSDWERLVAPRARTLLDNGDAAMALGLIRERTERTPDSPLVSLEAEALVSLDRIDEAWAALDRGADRARAAQLPATVFALSRLQAEMMINFHRWDWSAQVNDRLAGLAAASADPAYRLAAEAVWAATARGRSILHEEPASELQRAFDAVDDEALASDRSLAALAGSEFRRRDDAGRLGRVVALIGLPRRDENAVRRLAGQIAQFDRKLSTARREPLGTIAREFGIPEHKSGTEAWSSYLLDAADSDARSVITQLLDAYAREIPEEVIAAIADVVRTELRPLGWYPAAGPGVTEAPPLGDEPAKVVVSLSPDGLSTLIGSLADVFTLETLRWFLRLRMDLSLEALIPTGGSLATTLVFLIEELERRGRLAELVARAREVAPSDEGLLAVSREIGLSTLTSPGDDVEAVVASEGNLDLGTWRQRLGQIEGQVCLVERAGHGIGTGFLIGADILVTAKHVIESPTATDLQFRFDYKSLDDSTTITPGTVFQMDSGVVLFDEDLDFAVVSVQGSPGVQPVGGVSVESSGTPRGWIELPGWVDRPMVGSGLVIIHHPTAGPLKLTTASDAVAGFSNDGARLYHQLPTEPGSAGSPIFDARLQLVGVHLGWTPDALTAPLGFGVMADVIVDRLRAAGFGDAVGSTLA
jgi:hypothetical protein